MGLELNQPVEWKECPGQISSFSRQRVRGLSPCGRFALIQWVRHPIPVAALAPCEETESMRRYRPVELNQWGDDGLDSSTKENLTTWVEQYESKQRSE